MDLLDDVQVSSLRVIERYPILVRKLLAIPTGSIVREAEWRQLLTGEIFLV